MAQTNIEKLIAVLTGSAQDIENALQQLLVNRTIDNAVGAQEDIIGKLVGQLRLGLDDNTYRNYLRAKVKSNHSQGHFEDLISVTKLILNNTSYTITVQNEGTATVRVLIAGLSLTDAIGNVIFSFLTSAKVAGVRVVAEWMNSAPATTFTLDAGPGLDVGFLASGVG